MCTTKTEAKRRSDICRGENKTLTANDQNERYYDTQTDITKERARFVGCSITFRIYSLALPQSFSVSLPLFSRTVSH